MSNLTPKQEKFCTVYITTGNASEAYRQAYNVRPGTKPESTWRLAKALLDNVKVASRIKELQKPAADAATLTLTEHLKELQRLRDLATESEKLDAAIKAEIARGKASGLYVEKVNVDVNVSKADALRKARERAKQR